jgi:uncharacterized membrane protein YkgB
MDVTPIITPFIRNTPIAAAAKTTPRSIMDVLNTNVPYWKVEILLIGFSILLIVLLILSRYKFFKMWKESGLSIFALHPYLGQRWSQRAARLERNKAKAGRDYASAELTDRQKREVFLEFIQGLPTFCLTDNIFSTTIRSLMSRGGARYQRVVLHDPGSTDDVYLYVRRVGDYFIHEGGIYLWPWKNSKNVLHWDITDCRPLVDFHEGAQWDNPRMNARYFWSIVNKITASAKSESPFSTTIIIIGLVIVVIVVVLAAYLQYEQVSHLQELVANLNVSRSSGISVAVART